MGLFNKIFGGEKSPQPPDSVPSGTRFDDSDDTTEELSRSAARREMVQLALRENMRRHAIPSDWLDCRMLPVVKRNRRTGMHLQLVVRQGQASLLGYVPAFQSGLMAEIEKFEPRAWDWLLSISWEFEGITARTGAELPGAGQWKMAAAGAAVPAAAAAATAAAGTASAGADDEVMQDLKALFAIRDAALQQSADEHPDFEPTRPAFSNSDGGPGR
jgi:hypothetical protein